MGLSEAFRHLWPVQGRAVALAAGLLLGWSPLLAVCCEPQADSACRAARSTDGAELVVTKVTRLTPPEVNAGEPHYGVREPWNADMKRITFWESNPHNGQVWAFIDDLRKAKTLAQYEAARKPVSRQHEFREFSWWSPFKGEENIMYALHRATRRVVRWDVDTETAETVVSYDPDDGTDVGSARLMGWTTDGHLICNLENENAERGAWEIDVKANTRTFRSHADIDSPSNERRWPCETHGHSGPSPDHTMWASYYGEARLTKIPSGELIRELPRTYFDPPVHQSYLSWRASNRWWVASSFGVGLSTASLQGPEARTAWVAEPHVDTFIISQCWIDGTSKILYETKAAGYWHDGEEIIWNWGQVIATVRRDGRQIVFSGTDGKYSAEDHERRGVEPWGLSRLFLLDLAFKYPDDEPGNAGPTGPERDASP